MRFVRIGERGREVPAVIDGAGTIRDISQDVKEINPDFLRAGGHRGFTAATVEQYPKWQGAARVGPCVSGVGKIVCVGLNYREHARESNMPIPTEPILFLKSPTAISGPHDDIIIPRGATKVDWEVELCVVMGAEARYVSERVALEHVAGYCIINDVSERAFQLERGGQWDKGKGCDSFGPIGPWFVTADEIPDPQELDLWLEVNGQRRQRGHTGDMIFKVRHLIHYISQMMTLMPGDLIATGTPSGIGMGARPHPVYLREGDEVRLGITGLGEQLQRVTSWDPCQAITADP